MCTVRQRIEDAHSSVTAFILSKCFNLTVALNSIEDWGQATGPTYSFSTCYQKPLMSRVFSRVYKTAISMNILQTQIETYAFFYHIIVFKHAPFSFF